MVAQPRSPIQLAHAVIFLGKALGDEFGDLANLEDPNYSGPPEEALGPSADGNNDGYTCFNFVADDPGYPKENDQGQGISIDSFGSITPAHFNSYPSEPGLNSPGSSSWPYSPECVEYEFYELRLLGLLGSSPPLASPHQQRASLIELVKNTAIA